MFAAVLVSILFASSLIPCDVDASDNVQDVVKSIKKPVPPKVKKPAPPKGTYPADSYLNYQGYDGYDNYISESYQGKGKDYYQPQRFVCKYDRDCGKGWECSNGNCVPFCEKCYEFSFIVGQCVAMCAKNAVCNTLKEGGPEGKCICKNCPGMDGYDKVANCIPPKGAKGLCFSYAYRRSFLKNFGYPPPHITQVKNQRHITKVNPTVHITKANQHKHTKINNHDPTNKDYKQYWDMIGFTNG